MFIKSETLVNQAKTSSKLPNFIWAIILSLIFLNVGSMLGYILIIPLIMIISSIPTFASNPDFLMLLASLLSFVGISLLIFFRVVKIEKRNISSIGFCKQNWLKKYLIGFLIGLVLMSLVVLILYLFGFVSVENSTVQPIGKLALLNISIILIGWIIQGGTEEILTRGWLMNILGAKYNINFGLFVSSVLFGLLHLFNPNVNLIAILNIVLVGYLFGLYVIKTNDLWGACGMHSAWNFAQGNLFGFEVSGLNVSIGSLFDFKLIGNEVISGGTFGPEAGLVSTFVLILGIVTVILLDKNNIFKKYF